MKWIFVFFFLIYNCHAEILFDKSDNLKQVKNFWYNKVVGSNTMILGFNEAQSVKLNSVELQKLNKWDHLKEKEVPNLSADTLLDSHMLYCYQDRKNLINDRINISAEIEFSSPILGFVGDGYLFAKSNEYFAPNATHQKIPEKPNKWSLEEKQSWTELDKVTILSPTRIKVEFTNHSAIDPLRVITLRKGQVLSVAQKKNEKSFKDIEYVAQGHVSQKLDIYLPKENKEAQLVVWIHGGAWRAGDKAKVPILALLDKGYAIASVNYRLSPVAKFPAQIHDLKAAVRYLRANQNRYGYSAQKIIVAGASAGGHLAALLGVVNGHSELEGKLGSHLTTSSDVHGIIDYYGPTNFLTILKQSTPHGLGVRIPALQLLLRAQPEDVPDLAKLASPVFHVDKNDPRLLLIHGDQDPQVPIGQSHELHGTYKKAGLADRVTFEVIHGGAHGGGEFYDHARMDLVSEFLDSIFK